MHFSDSRFLQDYLLQLSGNQDVIMGGNDKAVEGTFIWDDGQVGE